MTEVYNHLMPLEERIYVFFKDQVLFSALEVRKKFPEEGEKAIYRALNKLEATQRIRFAHWANRRKVYTTSGVSGLPVIKTVDGSSHPLGILVKNIAVIYDKNGVLGSSKELNDYVTLMCQLFIIAQEDNEKEKKRQFLQVHNLLIERRELLLRMIGNIDAVVKHPAMSGDMEMFTKTFMDPQDKAVPTAEELLEYRRWTYQTFGSSDD